MKIYKSVSKLLFVLLCCVSCTQSKLNSLTILHTNDTHSQVEPLEEGKRDALCGGYARRMGLIKKEREQNPNLLLFDAGDFSQGTPYFNFYHGRIEVDAMNKMGYDVVTLGNHEFDNGIDTLAVILQNAQFNVVCANYDVTGTVLEDLVSAYVVIHRANVRIGVFGIGVNPQGLIAEKNFFPLKYLEPISAAQDVANVLKYKENCDIVICLSHQGTHSVSNVQISDVNLAQSTRNIDIIIGAHTHKVVTNYYVPNLDGDSVLLAQVGKSGTRIGKIMVQMYE